MVSPVLINNINSSIAFVLLPHYHLVSFHQSHAEINLGENQIKCSVKSLHHFPSLVPEQGLSSAFWIFTACYSLHIALYCSYPESPYLMSLFACGKEAFINNYTIRKHPRALPFTVFANSFSMLFLLFILRLKSDFIVSRSIFYWNDIQQILSHQLPFTNCLQDAKQSDMWPRKSLNTMIDPIVSVPNGFLDTFYP